MKNEQARIREAVRKIDVAEKWLIDNAFKPYPTSVGYKAWCDNNRKHRRGREDAIIELIDACRKFLKPGG